MNSNFADYTNSLQSAPLDEITEHTHRSVLENLLNEAAQEVSQDIKVLHEPKRTGEFGSPDFKVYNARGIIGYVENKKIGENLDETRKSDQIKRYKNLSGNILITNYTEFMLIKGSQVVAREVLCFPSDLENRRFKPSSDKVQSVVSLLTKFFDSAPIGIGRADEFAKALAIRSHYLRDFLIEELDAQEENAKLRDKLWGLKDNMQNHIFNELTNREFADAYAQMLAYGLFLAKLNADTKEINLRNVDSFIPGSFALIRELVEFLKILEGGEHYKKVKWIVEEILSIINNLDLPAITETLTFVRKQKYLEQDEEMKLLFEKDPYVYFYEDYLAAFDRDLRKSKGVYYTPPPVVNFIIRAIDDILKRDFAISDGFADRNQVTVLDFAAGTGTFILQILQKVFESLPAESGKRDQVVKEHILKNIYGFEYLIAPYTIAHLKLSQFLKDQGYEMSDDERLQIYLTNTLEPVKSQIDYNFPELSREGKNANEIKEKPILVITGNPPYSYVSKNTGKWITDLVRDYYFVDGKKLDERNPKGLQDDYVKFIRFAQWKIEQAGEGIVGIITNHSFLDNPTFRGMRQSLMNTFDQMYFLDLHGNAKKKEKTPEGGKDENVFDIEQGVAISIMVKKKGLKKGIYQSDFYGLRKEKYNLAIDNSIESIDWIKLVPQTPYYFFRNHGYLKNKEYHNFISVRNMFDIHIDGIKTHRDHFAIGFNNEEVLNRIKDFINIKIDDKEISTKYNIKDTRDWKINKNRMELSKYKSLKKYLKRINYKPFDSRVIFYDKTIVELPRPLLKKNLLRKNYGLAIGRAGQNVGIHYLWNLCFITNIISDTNLFRRGGATIYPLFIYDTEKEDLFNNNGNEKEENFKSEFRKTIDSKYRERQKHRKEPTTDNPLPEEILGYIYAVLHSPTYREKYSEFLKSDFPRIPFTDDEGKFYLLADLGWDLIQKHLMNDIPKDGKYAELGNYMGKGINEVIKPDYNESQQRLYINKNQYFDNVPPEVYEFYIGGYQVLNKYLKDRKGRTLSLDEIENVENVVKILAFTIDQMERIDEETRQWI